MCSICEIETLNDPGRLGMTLNDYRFYKVDPPDVKNGWWTGLPLLNDMPLLRADSESGLRSSIDHAHNIRMSGTRPPSTGDKNAQ